MLQRVFKAFSYPEFRLLWFGACVSSIGTWMQIVAQSWLVYELSRSERMLGLDAFLGQIPIMLFSLLGGVIADRRDRRALLVASQVVQLSCAFLLAGLYAAGLLKVWHILCLSFTVGLAQAFGGPAYQALVPTLVKAEDLPNAIALNSIQFNLARVIGPMLGGLALKSLGAAWCFSLNGLSYLAVIFSLVSLKPGTAPEVGSLSMLGSMKEGLRFIWGQRAMLSLITLAFSMTVLSYPLIVFLPVFAQKVFQGDSDTYTRLLCVSGAGSVAGALLVAGLLGPMARKGRTALLLLISLGVMMTGFALSPSLPWSYLALFLANAALIGVFAMVTSLVQLLTGNEMKGRVMSVYNVAFRGGMPIGALIAGELISRSSAPLVLACNGAVLAALGMWFLLGRRGVAAL